MEQPEDTCDTMPESIQRFKGPFHMEQKDVLRYEAIKVIQGAYKGYRGYTEDAGGDAIKDWYTVRLVLDATSAAIEPAIRITLNASHIEADGQ